MELSYTNPDVYKAYADDVVDLLVAENLEKQGVALCELSRDTLEYMREVVGQERINDVVTEWERC